MMTVRGEQLIRGKSFLLHTRILHTELTAGRRLRKSEGDDPEHVTS